MVAACNEPPVYVGELSVPLPVSIRFVQIFTWLRSNQQRKTSDNDGLLPKIIKKNQDLVYRIRHCNIHATQSYLTYKTWMKNSGICVFRRYPPPPPPPHPQPPTHPHPHPPTPPPPPHPPPTPHPPPQKKKKNYPHPDPIPIHTPPLEKGNRRETSAWTTKSGPQHIHRSIIICHYNMCILCYFWRYIVLQLITFRDVSAHGLSFRILDWTCYHQTPFCQIHILN